MNNFISALKQISDDIEHQGFSIIEQAFSSVMIEKLLQNCLNNHKEFTQASIGREQN